jgi:hypothetical protein
MALGEQGEFGAESGENALKTGNKEHQQEHEHGECEREKDDRVEQRRHHLAAHLAFPGLEVGDLGQHHVEESARFARLDHGDIDAGEGVRGTSHGLGQGNTIDDQPVDLTPLGAGGIIRRLLLKDHHRAAERNARGEQA